jgi:hypothetical protein
MCYEPPAINFHPGETPTREPPGRGEHRGSRIATRQHQSDFASALRLPGLILGSLYALMLLRGKEL